VKACSPHYAEDLPGRKGDPDTTHRPDRGRVLDQDEAPIGTEDLMRGLQVTLNCGMPDGDPGSQSEFGSP
jgi:hypothetical protein